MTEEEVAISRSTPTAPDGAASVEPFWRLPRPRTVQAGLRLKF